MALCYFASSLCSHSKDLWLFATSHPLFALTLKSERNQVLSCCTEKQKRFCRLQHIPARAASQTSGAWEAICSSGGDETRLRTVFFLATLFPAGKAIEKAKLSIFWKIASTRPIWCLPVMENPWTVPETGMDCHSPLQRGIRDLRFPG